MSADMYLDKLEKLGGFPFREGRLTPSVQATESQLAALVAQEVAAAMAKVGSEVLAYSEDVYGVVIAEHAEVAGWLAEYPFPLTLSSIIALALPTTKQEG